MIINTLMSTAKLVGFYNGVSFSIEPPGPSFRWVYFDEVDIRSITLIDADFDRTEDGGYVFNYIKVNIKLKRGYEYNNVYLQNTFKRGKNRNGFITYIIDNMPDELDALLDRIEYNIA